MIPKIENRSYSYAGLDVCTISATLNIYTDDLTKVLDSFGISASYNMKQTDFVTEVTRQLNAQVNEYMTKLAELDAVRQQRFPTSTDFESAVNQVFDPIQMAIGG